MADAEIRPPTLLAMPSYLVANVARPLHARWLEELAGHGLRPWHYAILAALQDFGPLAQHELADRLDIKRSNLVGYVDELADRGLLMRDRDASDRRRQNVSLTSGGVALLRTLEDLAQRSQPDLLAVLSQSECATLLELLRRVLRSYDEGRLPLER
jgi:DNA-binding MarR family transcriptional regulator